MARQNPYGNPYGNYNPYPYQTGMYGSNAVPQYNMSILQTPVLNPVVKPVEEMGKTMAIQQQRQDAAIDRYDKIQELASQIRATPKGQHRDILTAALDELNGSLDNIVKSGDYGNSRNIIRQSANKFKNNKSLQEVQRANDIRIAEHKKIDARKDIREVDKAKLKEYYDNTIPDITAVNGLPGTYSHEAFSLSPWVDAQQELEKTFSTYVTPNGRGGFSTNVSLLDKDNPELGYLIKKYTTNREYIKANELAKAYKEYIMGVPKYQKMFAERKQIGLDDDFDKWATDQANGLAGIAAFDKTTMSGSASTAGSTAGSKGSGTTPKIEFGGDATSNTGAVTYNVASGKDAKEVHQYAKQQIKDAYDLYSTNTTMRGLVPMKETQFNMNPKKYINELVNKYVSMADAMDKGRNARIEANKSLPLDQQKDPNAIQVNVGTKDKPRYMSYGEYMKGYRKALDAQDNFYASTNRLKDVTETYLSDTYGDKYVKDGSVDEQAIGKDLHTALVKQTREINKKDGKRDYRVAASKILKDISQGSNPYGETYRLMNIGASNAGDSTGISNFDLLDVSTRMRNLMDMHTKGEITDDVYKGRMLYYMSKYKGEDVTSYASADPFLQSYANHLEDNDEQIEGGSQLTLDTPATTNKNGVSYFGGLKQGTKQFEKDIAGEIGTALAITNPVVKVDEGTLQHLDSKTQKIVRNDAGLALSDLEGKDKNGNAITVDRTNVMVSKVPDSEGNLYLIMPVNKTTTIKGKSPVTNKIGVVYIPIGDNGVSTTALDQLMQTPDYKLAKFYNKQRVNTGNSSEFDATYAFDTSKLNNVKSIVFNYPENKVTFISPNGVITESTVNDAWDKLKNASKRTR